MKMNDAVISADGVYRYWLRRDLGAQMGQTKPKRMIFIMLNPSTADAYTDDPTIRRCMGFARREGCDSIEVVNLFAYRATRPADLRAAERAGVDIVGPDNDAWLRRIIRCTLSSTVVAAFGAHANESDVNRLVDMTHDFAEEVDAKTEWTIADVQLWCLGLTKDGYPRHPLMLRADAPLMKWH